MATIEYEGDGDINVTQPEEYKNSLSLAMAYVPYQEFEDLYDGGEALAKGTLFKKLYLPFTGKRYPQ